MKEEKEEQRTGRNKNTTVNKAYISGGEFRKKFDKISDSKELNKLLYRLAKEMLLHRTGTEYEDMYWIDAEECIIVAEIVDSNVEGKIEYPESLKKKLLQCKGLVTIHSHPSGLPPSISDFNSNFEHGYSLGVVIGHNGKVFVYRSNEAISETYFELKVALYTKKGYNEFESRVLAINNCMEHFDIEYKEVTIND